MKRKHAKEVYPGLILGGILDIDDMLELDPDVLVPLDHLPACVKDKGYSGEILYCPIPDFNILPDDELDRLIDKIIAHLEDGKRIAIFCIGGHGRTGYVAACVLFMLGERDPVSFLHNNYTPCAIETDIQYKAIERYKVRNRDRYIRKYGEQRI